MSLQEYLGPPEESDDDNGPYFTRTEMHILIALSIVALLTWATVAFLWWMLL